MLTTYPDIDESFADGDQKLNILIASSEVVPFAKTGGLADVCGTLPIELARLGHHVTVFVPAYRHSRNCGHPIENTNCVLDIPIGSKVVNGRLMKSWLPGSEVPVYLVDQPGYFDRPELYRENGEDYRDNCERFVFFCRSVLESIRLLELPVDVIHANDWQTGLLPAYQKIEYASAPGYEQIATLMTIHNMAYQGQFWHWDMLLTGIDWKYFNWHQMEFYGKLNLLKTGIVFADSINTVSPRYAQEIQHPAMGCGLENVLHHRREILSGIINGVDYDTWNPSVDCFLPAHYGPHDWQHGKGICKRTLQAEFGLPTDPTAPLLGIVGRLVDQKGFDLVAKIIEHWVRSSDAQWCILGTGEPDYHQLLERLAAEFPHKVGVRLEFNDRLAHLVEAGADMFVMPSRYEPCGLNQLYSLKYGTIPIVHATGGLADSIADCNGENLATHRANGFSFESDDAAALEHALTRACDTFRNDRSTWNQLVTTAMQQDWSWKVSAKKYVELYELTISRANQIVCA
jgi:starch synthase